MPELYSQWAKTHETNILEYLQDGYDEHTDWTPEIYNVQNRTAGVNRYDEMFGPSSVPIVAGDNVTTPEAEFQPGYPTVVRPVIFKSKMGVTEEQFDWNKYEGTLDKARTLGEAAKQTINKFGAHPFITAFNTSYTSYGDALPLASTVHTRPDGGDTQSNASSTSIALTEANLETGMIALKQQKSGQGRKLNLGNGNIILMVPEALDKEAMIITGSSLRSGTPNNDLNWYGGGKISVFVNPWIGSDVTDPYGNTGTDTQFHLLGRGKHKMRFVWDKAPYYKTWEDMDKDVMYTKVKFRGKVFWTNWLATWHSKGDATSYTS